MDLHFLPGAQIECFAPNYTFKSLFLEVEKELHLNGQNQNKILQVLNGYFQN